jgi:molybdopterin-containing oxidoreductase family membrane subunit
MSNSTLSYRFDRRWDFYLSLIVALAAMGIGSVGVLRVLLTGDHGALGSAVPWGLWVSVYVYFVWMEVGMILGYYALKHVLRVKGIETLGPVIVMAAICALVSALMIIGMDLGHPFRAWRALVFADFGSLMTWMIWLHTFYMVLLIVEFWAYHNDYEDLIKWLNWVNIPAGIALIGVIGSLFGVIAARPLWNSSVLPMAFAMSSLVAGTGLILLLHILFSPLAGSPQFKETAMELGRFLMWAILIGAIAALANLLVSLYPGVPARSEGMRLLLFGPYWWTIWVVHLGLGTALPLLLVVWFRKHIAALLIAAVLLVVTFVMVPLNLVIPGLAYPTPEIKGIANAYHHPRLSYDYFPNMTEWLVVAFAVGLGLLLFALAYRLILDPYYRRLALNATSEAQRSLA